MALTKNERRLRIKNRIRKVVSGTETRPRLAVFRSNKEIYAQVVDDVTGKTLAAASSRDKDISSAKGNKSEAATLVGKSVAEKAIKAGINTISFVCDSLLICSSIISNACSRYSVSPTLELLNSNNSDVILFIFTL